MEAVPRMPMLSFELKHSPEYVEFGPTLKKYIGDHYGEDPAHYNKSCNELEQLRQSAVHVSHDFMGCSTLKKYYSQLQFLQGRFPMLEGGEASIHFTWEEVYSGREMTLSDIKFEQACILYNIGALHSVLGAMDTRQSPDGMKVSCTHFQCASWAFEYLRDHFGCAAMSLDMTHELLTFQLDLMLAQAQECILEKSMTDSRKSSITAKVAAQIVEFYMTSLKHLDVCNSQELISSKRYKEWKKKIDIKVLFYTCITNFYMGRQSEDQQKHGLCLAYYTFSLEKLTECEKMAKNEIVEIQDSLRFTHDVVGGKHQAAKKDNDFVYHDKVPACDTLPEIKGASLVKGIPFNPNDPEISGQDIFIKLVPMSAHEAASLYSEEKATLLRRLVAEMQEKDEELTQYLASLQLDQTSLNPVPEKLPQQLLEKCAALSVRPTAIKELVDSMTAVSNVATEVDLGITDIQQALQEESAAELKFQDTFGKRNPNAILSEIAHECSRLEEGHKKGSQSNTDLHKAMNTHINNLKLLSSPLEELQKLLPAVDKDRDPESQDVIKQLNSLLAKIEEMRGQRQGFEEQLRKEVMEDDITGVLCKQEGANREVLFTEQLKKHDKTTNLIRQNLTAQNNILRALTDANAKYGTVRKATSEALMRRELTIRDLINSYDVYEDLKAKSQKGLEFYKKLETNVGRLLTRCRNVCKVQHDEREKIYSKYQPKAPAPTRPSVSRAAPIDTGGDEQIADVPGVPAVPHPPAHTTVAAMFDGPKLKDYLPFMKPKTFGKKDGSPPVSAHPSVQDYMNQGGSLPNSGTASPVHMPQISGSMPASPDHFRHRFEGRLGPTDPSTRILPRQPGPDLTQGHLYQPVRSSGPGQMPDGQLGMEQGHLQLDSSIYRSDTLYQQQMGHGEMPTSQSDYVPLDQRWKKDKPSIPQSTFPQTGQRPLVSRSLKPQTSQAIPPNMSQQPNVQDQQNFYAQNMVLGKQELQYGQHGAPQGQAMPNQAMHGGQGPLQTDQYGQNVADVQNHGVSQLLPQQPMRNVPGGHMTSQIQPVAPPQSMPLTSQREITNTVSAIGGPLLSPGNEGQDYSSMPHGHLVQPGQIQGQHMSQQGQITQSTCSQGQLGQQNITAQVPQQVLQMQHPGPQLSQVQHPASQDFQPQVQGHMPGLQSRIPVHSGQTCQSSTSQYQLPVQQMPAQQQISQGQQQIGQVQQRIGPQQMGDGQQQQQMGQGPQQICHGQQQIDPVQQQLVQGQQHQYMDQQQIGQGQQQTSQGQQHMGQGHPIQQTPQYASQQITSQTQPQYSESHVAHRDGHAPLPAGHFSQPPTHLNHYSQTGQSLPGQQLPGQPQQTFQQNVPGQGQQSYVAQQTAQTVPHLQQTVQQPQSQYAAQASAQQQTQIPYQSPSHVPSPSPSQIPSPQPAQMPAQQQTHIQPNLQLQQQSQQQPQVAASFTGLSSAVPQTGIPQLGVYSASQQHSIPQTGPSSAVHQGIPSSSVGGQQFQLPQHQNLSQVQYSTPTTGAMQSGTRFAAPVSSVPPTVGSMQPGPRFAAPVSVPQQPWMPATSVSGPQGVQQQFQHPQPPQHSSPAHSVYISGPLPSGPGVSAPSSAAPPQNAPVQIGQQSGQLPPSQGIQPQVVGQGQAQAVGGYNAVPGSSQNQPSPNIPNVSAAAGASHGQLVQGQSSQPQYMGQQPQTSATGQGQFNQGQSSQQQFQGQHFGPQPQISQAPSYSVTNMNRQFTYGHKSQGITGQPQVVGNTPAIQVQQPYSRSQMPDTQVQQVPGTQSQQTNSHCQDGQYQGQIPSNQRPGVPNQTVTAHQYEQNRQGQMQNQNQSCPATSQFNQTGSPKAVQQVPSQAHSNQSILQPQVLKPTVPSSAGEQGHGQSTSPQRQQNFKTSVSQSEGQTVQQTLLQPQGQPMTPNYQPMSPMHGSYQQGTASSSVAIDSQSSRLKTQDTRPTSPIEVRPPRPPLQTSRESDVRPGHPHRQTAQTSVPRSIPVDRQLSTASSLDEILSSSPEARRVVAESVLAPKVLTAQEIQQQKADQLKNSSLQTQPKDPYKDKTKLDRFVAEVEKLAKFVEGFEKPLCSGPTPLDVVWKEIMEDQDKAGRQQKLAIARCYPMKNRDQDVMPYDASRVLLTTLKDDYINASWINDLSPSCPKFIATQAPLPVTLADYWLMVYEQGVEVLVALSNETETGKKFPVYLPKDKGEAMEHGAVQITLQSIKQKPLWTERILHLRHAETRTGRTLVHLHYNAWPVSGFPDKVSHILQFITEVHSFYREQRSLMKPIVVHCSNGVGRTGMFQLIYVGMQEINHGDGIINVQDAAGKMLWKRRSIILKQDQLKYCYEAILYYAQDVLAKEGILVHKASFGDELPKPGAKSIGWEPGQDILFGSMSFTSLQSNIAKLSSKPDSSSSNIDQKLEMLKKGESSEVKDDRTDKLIEKIDDLSEGQVMSLVGGNSLPDVVQNPGLTLERKSAESVMESTLDDLEKMEEQVKGQGHTDDIFSNLDQLKIEHRGSISSLKSVDSADFSKGSRSSSVHASPAHQSCETSSSPNPEHVSSLAELQDPTKFTIGTSEGSKKKKVTKADFTGENKAIIDQDPNDPLSSLDPFWTLK